MTARRAFTLIEMMLAIVLILALSAGLMSFAWGTLASRDRTVQAADRARQWSKLTGLIEGAVLTSFAKGAGGTFGGDGVSLRVPCRLPHVAPGERGDVLEIAFDAGSGAVTVGFGGAKESLVGGVASVAVRYWDGSAWQEKFDAAAAGTLPGAVELALWYGAAGSVRSESGAGAVAPERGEPDCWRIFAIPDGRGPENQSGVDRTAAEDQGGAS